MNDILVRNEIAQERAVLEMERNYLTQMNNLRDKLAEVREENAELKVRIGNERGLKE